MEKRGFALVDVLLVLVVLAIVAAIIVPRLLPERIKSEAENNLMEIARLENTYQAENGHFLACPMCPNEKDRAWVANAEFEKLGFAPNGSNNWQYEVVLAGSGYKAVARDSAGKIFYITDENSDIKTVRDNTDKILYITDENSDIKK